MTEEISKPPHSPKFYRDARDHFMAVGMVAGSWATFELNIDIHALELANMLSDAGYCFTAQIMGSANKLNAYIAVAQVRGAKKALAELEPLAKDMLGLSEQRNRVVHDPWILSDGTPVRFEITAKRKLRKMRVPTPTQDIKKLGENIRKLQDRFLDVHARVMAEVGT